MIESLQTLFTNHSFPSLHVMVIHFPIALICLAPLFDLGCLILRDQVWLDRVASLLYVTGTLGAGAAYLSGERAAKALAEISPAAESALADHQSSALITLIALAIVSLFRLWVSWLSRADSRISLGFFRLAAIPLALAGLALLAFTADRGGSLVYGHGLGVQIENAESLEPLQQLNLIEATKTLRRRSVGATSMRQRPPLEHCGGPAPTVPSLDFGSKVAARTVW